jgi:C_GCAxxG_C_C family probable redox protein
MKEDQIKEMVYKNYRNGFHCAEAIANTIHELFPEKSGSVCKVASGFCGGIGRCRQDVCGALSGGIIALGSVYGREKGGEDISKVVFLSAEIRRLFVEKFKTTVCKDIIDDLENIPDCADCKDVTAKTTWFLYKLISNDMD